MKSLCKVFKMVKWCSTSSLVVFSLFGCGLKQNYFPCYSSTPTLVFRWYCMWWSRATIEWVGLSPRSVLNSSAFWLHYLLFQSNPDSFSLNQQPVRHRRWRCFLFLLHIYFSLKLVQTKTFFFIAVILGILIIFRKQKHFLYPNMW